MRFVRFLVLLGLLVACGGPKGETVAGEPVQVWEAKPGAPAVVLFHGFGETEDFGDGARRKAIERLHDAGYLVASSRAGGDAWGNATAVRADQALIDTLDRKYRPRSFVVLAESMGALAALQVRVPRLARWVGVSPVVDAAGLAARSDYYRQSMLSAGGVPAPEPRPSAPAVVVASPDDTLVPPSLSALPHAEEIPCRGGHTAPDCWSKAAAAVLAT